MARVARPLPDLGFPGTRVAPPATPRPGLLRLWQQRIIDREAQAALGEREPRDMRASPREVAAELRKPFWRA